MHEYLFVRARVGAHLCACARVRVFVCVRGGWVGLPVMEIVVFTAPAKVEIGVSVDLLHLLFGQSRHSPEVCGVGKPVNRVGTEAVSHGTEGLCHTTQAWAHIFSNHIVL